MAKTRTIEWSLTQEDVDALCEGLNRLRLRAEGPWLADLQVQLRLAWMEAEFRDEADAHNDWVNREMCGEEIQPDPDAVVRYLDGRNVVVRW